MDKQQLASFISKILISNTPELIEVTQNGFRKAKKGTKGFAQCCLDDIKNKKIDKNYKKQIQDALKELSKLEKENDTENVLDLTEKILEQHLAEAKANMAKQNTLEGKAEQEVADANANLQQASLKYRQKITQSLTTRIESSKQKTENILECLIDLLDKKKQRKQYLIETKGPNSPDVTSLTRSINELENELTNLKEEARSELQVILKPEERLPRQSEIEVTEKIKKQGKQQRTEIKKNIDRNKNNISNEQYNNYTTQVEATTLIDECYSNAYKLFNDEYNSFLEIIDGKQVADITYIESSLQSKQTKIQHELTYLDKGISEFQGRYNPLSVTLRKHITDIQQTLNREAIEVDYQISNLKGCYEQMKQNMYENIQQRNVKVS